MPYDSFNDAWWHLAKQVKESHKEVKMLEEEKQDRR